MSGKFKFFLILMVILSFNVIVVSASDVNSTDDVVLTDNNDVLSVDDNLEVKTADNSSVNESDNLEKTTPSISIDSSKVQSRNSLSIYLKDSSGNALKSKILNALIDNKNYSIKTNSKGVATLKLDLVAKNYKLKITFSEDDKYNSVSKTFNIKISKAPVKIVHFTNFVNSGNNLYVYLTDQNWNPISYKKLTLVFNGKTYNKKTNQNGRIGVKIKASTSRYNMKVKFNGDSQFKSSSSSFKLYVVKGKSLTIGNTILITKGFLRVYLKDSKNSVSKKTITVNLGGKQFSKKTNSEGIVVIKPDVGVDKYTVTAKVGKYAVSKRIKCVEDDVKDPLKENISLINGIPNIDVMPGNYVMGDDSATYTLTKSQYLDVIKRDSYCLFLNNKLSKYTFFKTKHNPNLNHIIKRGKWNVIERAINTKLVKKNKVNYWPGSIKVSLKGKAYTYSEVRDVQNTGYTCGPTSASVCSQVLRNYICEKQIAKLAGTNKDGTKCGKLATALDKNNFKCTFFYKASFDKALEELKIGGCALVFHTKNHYVSILDISNDGKKVLVSNSYGSYYNIPTKWLTVKYMKTRFYVWEDSLIVRLNYQLSNSTKDDVNCFYNSMGTNWARHNTQQSIGRI